MFQNNLLQKHYCCGCVTHAIWQMGKGCLAFHSFKICQKCKIQDLQICVQCGMVWMFYVFFLFMAFNPCGSQAHQLLHYPFLIFYSVVLNKKSTAKVKDIIPY